MERDDVRRGRRMGQARSFGERQPTRSPWGQSASVALFLTSLVVLAVLAPAASAFQMEVPRYIGQVTPLGDPVALTVHLRAYCGELASKGSSVIVRMTPPAGVIISGPAEVQLPMARCLQDTEVAAQANYTVSVDTTPDPYQSLTVTVDAYLQDFTARAYFDVTPTYLGLLEVHVADSVVATAGERTTIRFEVANRGNGPAYVSAVLLSPESSTLKDTAQVVVPPVLLLSKGGKGGPSNGTLEFSFLPLAQTWQSTVLRVRLTPFLNFGNNDGAGIAGTSELREIHVVRANPSDGVAGSQGAPVGGAWVLALALLALALVRRRGR